MDEFATLTEEQVDEYISKLPVNESNESVRVIVGDYTLEEELERGSAFDAEEVINNIGKRREKKG